MIPNNKPWQTILNDNLASTTVLIANNLSVVKKAVTPAKLTTQGRVVNPKRYSFDDNGGGYLGL